MLPATATRVAKQTPEPINDQIRCQIEANIQRYANSRPSAIDSRLIELEHEWDMERTLQTNFAILTLAAVSLSQLVSRGWLLLSAAAGGFMLQHALQGWCPPVSIFRRCGVRTTAEIDTERYALRAIRGDFREPRLPPPQET